MDSIRFIFFNLLLYLFFFGVTFFVDFVLFFTLSRVLKFKKSDYLTALITSLVGFALSVVLQIILDISSGFLDYSYLYVIFQGIGFIISLFPIKYFYKENWKKTITICFIVFAVDLAVIYLLSFLVDFFFQQMNTTETFIKE
jgi:hypothetical protein